MPSSIHTANRKKRQQSNPNKSFTRLSTATPNARPIPTVPPSASYSEGQDTVTFITTHLPSHHALAALLSRHSADSLVLVVLVARSGERVQGRRYE